MTRLVSALLILASIGFAAFAVLVVADADTQLLGLSIGVGLAAAAAAAVVAGKTMVSSEPAIEPRPHLGDPEGVEELKQRLTGDGAARAAVSRRRLLFASAGAAGTALAAAVAAPITAVGPPVGESIKETPWRAGKRLVDEEGKPITAEDIPEGSFVTAFPEGADKRELGSPVVVVRDDPKKIESRREWAPEGILAFSKICTHAGCAIALYRAPLYEPTSTHPALECPCHYSVFSTREAGKVEQGPAGRPLPQLPLAIGPDRELRAAGGFSGPIGPSWWSARS
jgi:ubiquinol-cytochrome c reductase iron-sulfur subunit